VVVAVALQQQQQLPFHVADADFTTACSLVPFVAVLTYAARTR